MQLDCVTPLILTFNEMANIERTLAALNWASRILVVDSFSDDGTLGYVRRHPRVNVVQRQFDTFAAQCNFGLDHIDTEWVLSLDADYVCSEDLIREMAALPDSPLADGFQVTFRYCVRGRPLRGSLYPPRTVLYRRERAHYEADGHAHRVKVDGQVSPLSSVIYHDDRKSLNTWLAAQARYAANEVRKLRSATPGTLSFSDRVRRAKWIAPLVMPFYCLILKGLILDGLAGFEYTFQRTYAELLLSLRLMADDAVSPVAQNEHSMPMPKSDARRARED